MIILYSVYLLNLHFRSAQASVMAPVKSKEAPIKKTCMQEVTIPTLAVQREVALLMWTWEVPRQKYDLLGLPKFARLEPSSTLQDVGLFETQAVPFTCTWYIAGPNGRVLHISPLLQIPGVTLDSWCIDLLHTWHYGPMSTFLIFAIRALLHTDLYRSGNATWLDQEENEKLALLALRSELWMFYKERRAEDPNWSKRGSEAGLLQETTNHIGRPELGAGNL